MTRPALLVAVLVVAAFLVVAPAKAQTVIDDYDGFVDLRTPTGHIVPFWWYIRFDPGGNVFFNASGAISGGHWYQVSASERLIFLNNAPYNSVIVVQRLPFTPTLPDMIVTYFQDDWGNTVANSRLYVFEN